ncbi:Type IV pilus biogenesis factor PilY1 [Tepidimonas alkaliphilus]|uniref:Type IV pilus biogenesis factor PilY1 n=1 Tax=Tepidimonas alkaliphilus TaxID=2588942 RepID=A0A554W4P1_9BURK|nr:PilC/PilY family type IV pilus protein [Tepidimonas alkaliphilus]TSE18549.1 Type IV pilus biogenesis factor PilY1 [Tepidimonas alkaliphilus]
MKISWRRWSAVTLGSFLLHHHAWAALNIPNVPLQLVSSVDPNVMLLLDDSGSMQFEIMPEEEIRQQTYYLYPRNDNTYGGAVYANRIPSFAVNANNPYGAIVRSPAFNTNYYDPSITYKPWVRHDGSSWPNANPACAPNNPARNDAGCRNLTQQLTESATWVSCRMSNPATNTTSCSTASSLTYWPAVYYRYNGGDKWSHTSYTAVEIRPTTPSYTGDGRERRTDCVNGVCTYQQEIQNFANWYSYYRSRIFATRAGTGRVFAAQGPNLRVGFATINAPARNVDGVNYSHTQIQGVRPFTGDDRRNFFDLLYGWNIPAAATPLRRALDAVGQYYSRTDSRGPWSTTPGVTGGTDISCRRAYTILMTDGYWNQGEADTAAARADNDSANGPTHTGPGGRSFTYTARSPFRDGRANTLADVAMYYWKNDLRPDLTNNVPTDAKNPAFWQHMVTMTISLGLSGAQVSPEAAFRAIQTGETINWPDPKTSDNSGGAAYPERLDDLLHAAVNARGLFVNAQNPDELERAFREALTEISNRNASGTGLAANARRITGNTLVYQSRFDSSNWSGDLVAYKVTASGVQTLPQWKASQQLPAPSQRKIFTRNSAGTGIPFLWGSLLPTERTVVGSEDILNYIRGDRSKEVANGGTLRNRGDHPLADFIHSEPVYHAAKDVVYVGGNGGMLHAFDGSTGQELFAYVPRAFWPALRDLTNPNYSHRYYVDGHLRLTTYNEIKDKTMLIAAAGRGARGFFALDVSNPRGFNASHVAWEALDPSDNDMGHVLGPFAVARLKNGTAVIITGNGYNSPNGKAVLFIIDAQTGATLRKIDTGVGGDNGMGPPSPVDEDGDGVVDYVYAGDLKGNLWKFDLRSNLPTAWGNAIAGNQPLFTARDPSNQPQPITAAPAWAVAPAYTGAGLQGRRMVFVATGSYFRSEDRSDTQTQSIYGLIDANSNIPNRAALLARGAPNETLVDGKPVRYFNDSSYSDYFNSSGALVKQGWVIDFTTKPGERFILQPELENSVRMVLKASSLIPKEDPCEPALSGYVNYLDPFGGGRLTFGFVDFNRSRNFDDDKINLGGGQSAYIGGYQTIEAALGSNPVFATGGQQEPGSGAISSGSDLAPPTISRIARCEQLDVGVQANGPNLLVRSYNCRSAWREVLNQ